jgi:hypothetical protein
MARSPQRVVALVAMVVLAPLSGLLVLWAWLFVEAPFDTSEETPVDWLFAVAAAAGFASTLAALAGLTAGSPRLTRAAAGVQAGAATWFLALEAAGFRIGDDDSPFILALVGVLIVDVVAFRAAELRGSARPRSPREWSLRGPMEPGTARRLAVSVMTLVAAASAPLLAVGLRDVDDDGYLVAVGAIGLMGAVVALVALMWRSRPVAAGVVAVQAVAAALVLALKATTPYEHWTRLVDDIAPTAVVVAILAAAAITMWAALLPKRSP